MRLKRQDAKGRTVRDTAREVDDRLMAKVDAVKIADGRSCATVFRGNKIWVTYDAHAVG